MLTQAQYAQGLAKLSGVKWTFHTKGEVISSPAVVAGVVYVGSTDGNLYAIDEQSGTRALEIYHWRSYSVVTSGCEWPDIFRQL